MNQTVTTDPKQFIADFFSSFTDDIVNSEEDAELVVDRYHTRDVIQFADGNPIDRDKLVAHVRPVRKKKPATRVEVHDALADGDRIAARYTLHVISGGKTLAIDVQFFGRFTPDGRMREGHMLTRSRD
ncbi:putative SnoaL-like aldol condensation-catalyzing enzyme [Saccharothrix ecbatanensis]|uniref:Putative SnoaL-like aldol condensation-catalyzing enzyme n=1 Tax=Saccharothrix ecbatanensis TaxID=1105145 RepID=A0A7W9HR28_9PSEU|nr:nuclear transport factor 2 family protein [Saccharothrix ecbatanensis]MBB5806927.1 putative SnoaL-like aldol condensation-catalyzing enzyme [Saccharothrix ecbatanensis]